MKEPLFLEPLFPDRSTGEALAVQLVRRLREAVESGALPAGMRMLGTRQLAKRLGLGRNTVALAFEQLVAEGYFEARSGSGTYVNAARLTRTSSRRVSRSLGSRQMQFATSLRALFTAARGEGPLRPGTPDPACFPRTSWMRSARKALAAYEGDLGYGPASGLRALREAIALHVRQFRGITADPEQIIVVEGAQAAMHLAAMVLAAPGDSIVIEDPCYALARAAFEVHGLEMRPIRVDRDGLIVEDLPKEARFAFVTPTHQFPLGGTLPVARRIALLAWARRENAYIIEDDYDSEFTSKGRPLPALQSLDRDERVIYVGSFSKTLAPAIRLGYAIAPPHLASAFRLTRAGTSLGVAVQLQATMATFISEGHFARHLRRTNGIYERRRTILTDALRELAGSTFEIGPSQTGLHVALIAKQRFGDRALTVTTDDQRLVALSTLCIKRRDCHGFVLGFTNGADAEIEQAAAGVVRSLHAPTRI